MFKHIEYDQAVQLLMDEEVMIADVRDEDSYRAEHIPNAIHLSMSMLQNFCLQSDKSTPILLYCYHGVTSQSVAQHLIDQGFETVYSLAGGFELWKENYSSAKE